MKRPKISVAVITYNHGKYIAQCLDGILMQKGDFDIEVIVADDCSTDDTSRIVQDYQTKHPRVVVVLPTAANMGMEKNVKRCFAACSGEYIAPCDGDDYWTDPYKLLKQSEFLTSHPDYALCFNAMVIYSQNTGTYGTHFDQLSLTTNTLMTEDLIRYNYIGNGSVTMYRTSIIRRLPEEIYDRFFGDWVVNMACGRMGKIGFLRDWMSVYRQHSGGVYSGASHINRLRSMIAAIETYNRLFDYDYDELFRREKELLERRIAPPLKPRRSLLIQAVTNPRKAFRKLAFLTKAYGPLVLRTIRHPKKAACRLRTVMRMEARRVSENRDGH